MSVLILAFVGGLLTILSPCILPVLPCVFARLGQPFRSSVLPMLVGMAVSFAAVGSLAAISGSWVVQANQTRSPAGPGAADRLRPGPAVSGPGRSAQPAVGAAG